MIRTGDPRRHVSFVIRKLCLALGHFEDTGAPPSISLMEMGSSFEDTVARSLAARWASSTDPALRGRYVQPGELELDGLIGTPDLFDTIDNVMIEVKLTKISSRNDIESTKFWKYWVQLMAYCHMMGTRTGRLHIGHINGDYSRTAGPDVIYNVWEDTFSPRQLADNWRMLVSHSG
jgi:hypothetical protein